VALAARATARLLPAWALSPPRGAFATGNELAAGTLGHALVPVAGATARPLLEIELSKATEAASTGKELPAGPLTPAPQPLHRIFWPTRARFVAKLRRQTGHANRTASPDSVSPLNGSIGAGTVATLPHRTHTTCRPMCDHSA